MYGLVNRAIEDLVTERFGRDAWLRIASRAGMREPVFVSHESYPDAITYALVAAASAESGIDAGGVLKAFGKYWIQHTGRVGYADLISGSGRDLGEFLENLPGLHTRVLLAFPQLEPPEFETIILSPNSARLEYSSLRPGLSPMVLGLLEGLGDLFQQDVTIEEATTSGDHEASFVVSWQPREAAA